MWEDPIVAEVHRIREQLGAQFGFDIQAMFADMRMRQAALGSRLVSLVEGDKRTAQTDECRDSGNLRADSSEEAPAA
jgi:hypothetical protein